jgi:D-alanyl-lipoteichoic acid acyltransferase DltB (MBOAT superfamily)
VLFNSYEFLLAFLPATCLVYFALNRWLPGRTGIAFLFVASCLFYAWWNWRFLPLLLGSIVFNYLCGRALQSLHGRAGGASDANVAAVPGRLLLGAAIVANLGLLGYFKYADFFVANVNALTGSSWLMPYVILPLGISFFTFTQIAFLVDAHRGEARELSFVNYGLFVSFFPHLLAGPILHHGEMMPQFAESRNKRFSASNFWVGLTLLVMGLAKKVLIADEIAPFANAGFGHAAALQFVDAWIAALAYTLQIYFDFSGYTDMALGMAWMLNIRLPLNFASPYRAVNIRDFWRRWHMTLSRFLRDYLYIPLGGNRRGPRLALLFVLVTFALGGLWHGANWTFVAWGVLNGLGVIAVQVMDRAGWSLPRGLAWALTMLFTIVAWVFFRASNLADALHIVATMFGAGGVSMASAGPEWSGLFVAGTWTRPGLESQPALLYTTGVMLAGFAIAWLGTNSQTLVGRWQWTPRLALGIAALAAAAFVNLDRVTEFLYFNF